MQDRYAGDVGDFVKLGLLRALSPGRKLGMAWYRYPDESHNGDGRHITYLDQPQRAKELLNSAEPQLKGEDHALARQVLSQICLVEPSG